MKKIIAMISLQIFIASIGFSTQAGTFKRAKKIEIAFCWDLETPVPECPKQLVELHTNGDAIVTVSGQQYVGTYDKGKRQGVKFIEIEYAAQGVLYYGEETSRRNYQGEMEGNSRTGTWLGVLSNL